MDAYPFLLTVIDTDFMKWFDFNSQALYLILINLNNLLSGVQIFII